MKLNKILIVVGQLGKGGLERQLAFLLESLLHNEVEVICVVWNFDQEDFYVELFSKYLGDNLVGYPTTVSSKSKMRELRSLIQREKPELAISFSAFTNIPVYLGCLASNTTSVGSLRTSAAYYLAHGGIKAKANLLWPSRLLVNSKRAIHEIGEVFPYRHFTQASYYRNVLDLQQFPVSHRENDSFQSISVGNVRKVKRLDRMIEMFVLLKKQGVRIQHVHIGGGSDLEQIKTKASDAGLDEEVAFLGPRHDVLEHLIQSHLFVHFSEYEGSPNVIMEAMAAGLPVITTACGDASEYVEHNVTGYVVDPYNSKEFSDYYLQLHGNVQLRHQMGASARHAIEDSGSGQVSQIFITSLQELGLDFSY